MSQIQKCSDGALRALGERWIKALGRFCWPLRRREERRRRDDENELLSFPVYSPENHEQS